MSDPNHESQIVEAVASLAARHGLALPAGPVPRPPLLHRIIVGVDEGEISGYAVEWAREFAREFRAVVHLVTAVPPAVPPGDWTGATADWATARAERGRAALAEAKKRLEAAGVSAHTELLRGAPTAVLARRAARLAADLVIVGSHSRGPAARALLGSVADGVKNHARTNVLIARRPPPSTQILAPVDGAGHSLRAALFAATLRHLWDGHLTVLHVQPEPGFASTEGFWPVDTAQQRIEEESWAPEVPHLHFRRRFGSPVPEIFAAADARRADLIVVGSRGLGTLRRWALGSVSSRLAHYPSASVLIVKEPGGVATRPALSAPEAHAATRVPYV